MYSFSYVDPSFNTIDLFFFFFCSAGLFFWGAVFFPVSSPCDSTNSLHALAIPQSFPPCRLFTLSCSPSLASCCIYVVRPLLAIFPRTPLFPSAFTTGYPQPILIFPSRFLIGVPFVLFGLCRVRSIQPTPPPQLLSERQFLKSFFSPSFCVFPLCLLSPSSSFRTPPFAQCLIVSSFFPQCVTMVQGSMTPFYFLVVFLSLISSPLPAYL